MAANYWLSSQANRWQISRSQIALSRRNSARYAKDNDEVEVLALGIWCANSISALCKRLSLRQRVVATACVYARRFFARVPYAAAPDPSLVCVACVYVAAKVEESPIHVRSVCSEAGKVWGEMAHPSFPPSSSLVAEMEFYLLEELDFDLIVHHPYRALTSLWDMVGKGSAKKKADGATGDESSSKRAKGDVTATSGSRSTPDLGTSSSAQSHSRSRENTNNSGSGAIERSGMGVFHDDSPVELEELDGQALQMAWCIVNDTYRTDIPLLFPPYLIACAATLLALSLHPPARTSMENSRLEAERARQEWNLGRGTEPFTPPPDVLTFLATLNVSMPLVADIIQELLDAYEVWHRVGASGTETTPSSQVSTPSAATGQDSSFDELPSSTLKHMLTEGNGSGMLARLEAMRSRRRQQQMAEHQAPSGKAASEASKGTPRKTATVDPPAISIRRPSSVNMTAETGGKRTSATKKRKLE